MIIPFFHHSNLTREFELEPSEVVLAEVRKHWLVFTLELLPYATIAVLPFALAPLLSIAPPLAPYANLAGLGTGIGRAALGIWLLIVWTSAWGAFTRYYLNVWVLTNLRVMEVIQHSYFHREVSSVLLSRVQDVTTEVKGAIFSLLNIGNIHVQSAGTVDEFHMNGIGGPAALRDIILAHTSRESKSSGL
ncbi:MAG: PH domain-containing protein [bacterium]|nr:PH domain-containing protein [bacterium]